MQCEEGGDPDRSVDVDGNEITFEEHCGGVLDERCKEDDGGGDGTDSPLNDSGSRSESRSLAKVSFPSLSSSESREDMTAGRTRVGCRWRPSRSWTQNFTRSRSQKTPMFSCS